MVAVGWMIVLIQKMSHGHAAKDRRCIDPRTIFPRSIPTLCLPSRVTHQMVPVHQNQTALLDTRQGCVMKVRVTRYDARRDSRGGGGAGLQGRAESNRRRVDVMARRRPPGRPHRSHQGRKAGDRRGPSGRGERINRWIAARLIDWPSTSCLHCRKPITVGQTWAVISNGEVTARFHQDCHTEWLAQQEAAARRAMGLDRSECK
jgi:hypothetical protein